jgi:energy-coupling factor transport system ATP-binding protein
MKAAVIFQDFSFSYRGQVQALSNINLVIPEGSLTAIAGLNGAGKTSLCLAVSGLVPHYFGGAVGGSVTVTGINTLQTEVSTLAERVGTVLEDYECQLVTMTVEEEVAFSLENRGIRPEEILPIVRETLQLVGLAGLEKREVSSLSGGQKQRLAIAAALAPKPAILVLDEPTSALDPEGVEELYGLLGRLNRESGLTVLVVEHDLSRVLPYADRLAVLKDGRIVAAGELQVVLNQLVNNAGFVNLTPGLWTLKGLLEKGSGDTFKPWLQNDGAIAELSAYLTARGVVKSA